jgi:hypothetical protein
MLLLIFDHRDHLVSSMGVRELGEPGGLWPRHGRFETGTSNRTTN